MRLTPEGGQLLSQTHAEFTLYGISALALVYKAEMPGANSSHRRQHSKLRTPAHNDKHKNKEKLTILYR